MLLLKVHSKLVFCIQWCISNVSILLPNKFKNHPKSGLKYTQNSIAGGEFFYARSLSQSQDFAE